MCAANDHLLLVLLTICTKSYVIRAAIIAYESTILSFCQAFVLNAFCSTLLNTFSPRF